MTNSTVDAPNFEAYTPAETAELICRAGVKKGNTRPDKVFLSAIFGGCILSFGCAVSLTAVTAPWYQENAPGLVKLVGAIVFPIGLVTIFLTGAELFTSTNMVGGFLQILNLLLILRLSLPWWRFSIKDYPSGKCYCIGFCVSLETCWDPSLSWP